ncbi:unnamed protein product, partial [Dibothriocephalus latus]
MSTATSSTGGESRGGGGGSPSQNAASLGLDEFKQRIKLGPSLVEFVQASGQPLPPAGMCSPSLKR